MSLAELDVLTPYLDGPTVQDLAFRLLGFSGKELEVECLRLADAMLDDMSMGGTQVGRLEHTLVLALLRAAVSNVTRGQYKRSELYAH